MLYVILATIAHFGAAFKLMGKGVSEKLIASTVVMPLDLIDFYDEPED